MVTSRFCMLVSRDAFASQGWKIFSANSLGDNAQRSFGQLKIEWTHKKVQNAINFCWDFALPSKHGKSELDNLEENSDFNGPERVEKSLDNGSEEKNYRRGKSFGNRAVRFVHVSVAGIELNCWKEKRSKFFKCKNCRNVTAKKLFSDFHFHAFVSFLSCGKFTRERTASDFGDVFVFYWHKFFVFDKCWRNCMSEAWLEVLEGGILMFWLH